MQRLKNKRALITGAARGIGEAIARRFVKEGAYVYITDIREELGARVALDLAGTASFHVLDVRREEDWKHVTSMILKEKGQLDILVNNAGIIGFEDDFKPHDPENALLKDWRAVHATNLDGVFLGCKYGIKAMRKQGKGSIINISSRSGIVGIPRAAAYASSKAAIRNHTKSVALYCAEEGLEIRCNSINPAAILTPMWDPMLGSGEERAKKMKQFVEDTPQKRFGDPDEVAQLAVLLASEEATYMTGADLNLDGGILAGSISSPSS